MSFAEATDRMTIDELRRRGSLKWTRGGSGVLGAFVAEMDFGTAPAVTAALRGAVERQEFGYLSDDQAAELSRACAEWQRAAYGWAVDPARIWPMPDVFRSLVAVITAFSRPGSPVILPTPAYMPFVGLPGQLGREAIQVPMLPGPDGRLTLDTDGIDAAFRAGGHLLVLVNPCNPVGRVYSRDELAAVADVVETHGGRVFADEIHAPLVYPGRQHVPYATVSAAAAGHAITAVAASKAWNLPGLKCAQLILGSEADVATWAAHWPVHEQGASVLGVRASVAAYRAGKDWLADVLAYLDGSRHLLADLVAEHLPGVGYTPPEGTYLAWLDCRALALTVPPARLHTKPRSDPTVPPARPHTKPRSDPTVPPARPRTEPRSDLEEFFLSRAGVLATDGALCGEAGRGFLRLNFATPRPVLTEMIRRMGKALTS
jgi:cysteine-S-conjugate beta-lyase